jgi:hypothetical protein
MHVIISGTLKKNNRGRKRTINGRWKGISNNFIALASIIGEGTRIEEEFGSSWYQKKTKGLWTNVIILYLDEDEE